MRYCQTGIMRECCRACIVTAGGSKYTAAIFSGNGPARVQGYVIVPSPVTHAAAGYLVSRLLARGSGGVTPGMVWAGVALSCLPDIDAAFGLLLGDMGRYHNHMMSSPFFAVLAATASGAVAWRLGAAFRPLRCRLPEGARR